jgi:hypothetical protein
MASDEEGSDLEINTEVQEVSVAAKPTTKPIAKQNALIPVAIAAVAVAAAAIIIVMTLMSSGGYKAAEQNFVNSVAGLINEAGNEQTASFSLTYDGKGADLETIFGIATPTEIISFNADAYIKGNEFVAALSAAIGDRGFDASLGFDGEQYYAAFPEATAKWLYLNVDGLLDAMGLTEEDIGGELPELDYNRLYSSVMNVVNGYLALAEPVAVETKETITGGKVSVDATKYSIPLSQKIMIQVAQIALGELQANENLLEYITATGQIDIESINANIADYEAEFAEMLVEATDDAYLTMNVWVKDGQVIARQIMIPEFEEDGFSYMILDDGKNFYAEVAMPNGVYSVELTNDGGYSGQIQIDNMTVTLDKVNLSKDLMYITSGKVIFSVVEMPMLVELTAEFSYKDNEQSVVIGGVLTDMENNGTKYGMGTLTLSAGIGGSAPQKPALDEQNGIDVYNFLNGDSEITNDVLLLLNDVFTKLEDVFGPEAGEWFTNMLEYVMGGY